MRDDAFIETLARAFHAIYRAARSNMDPPYEELADNLKQQNRDAVRDIPHKLKEYHYVVRTASWDDPPRGFSAAEAESMAQMEHQRWLDKKVDQGWRYGFPRDNARRINPAIMPWDELPPAEWDKLDEAVRTVIVNRRLTEVEREKDRDQVWGIPETLTTAGYTVEEAEGSPGGRLVSPPLKRPLRIGVSGHRILMDIAKIEAGIEAGLAKLEETLPGRQFVLYSPLAEGADRLVARAVLKRKSARLIVPLPLPQDDYERDFASPGSLDEFRALLAQATEQITLRDTPAPPGDERNAAYDAVGDYLLDHCSVLITAWDGRGAQGQGGTGDVVARARQRGLRIIWVHAGNRVPGTTTPTSLGEEQGTVTYEGV